MKPGRTAFVLLAILAAILLTLHTRNGNLVQAQTVSPQMLDPDLSVRTVVSGLTMPTSMAFLGDDDILVLEKTTGVVKRVVSGTVRNTVLDLAVNFASERGLLGI